ncbi:MAG TPA: zinc ribbon domain-containing protein [Candidatus Treponema faecavium]|nr:zinc ribbon domain-containing protein [Candidatus Treponema faecavium]
MKQQNKPRFFCEFCHAEVRPDAKICTKCGHFFASVRCPQCGKVGTLELFSNGCPDCGYAGVSAAQTAPRTAPQKKAACKPDRTERGGSDDSLPKWLYIVTGCVFALLCAVFYVMGKTG